MKIQKSKTHSNQLIYTVDEIQSYHSYSKLIQKLTKEFSLVTTSDIIWMGFNGVSQDFKKEDASIRIDWDIWFGLSIIAENNQAITIVEQIAIYMQTYQETKSSFFDRFKMLFRVGRNR